MQSRLEPVTRSSKLSLHIKSFSSNKDGKRPKDDPRRFKESLEKAKKKSETNPSAILDITSKPIATAAQSTSSTHINDNPKVGRRIDVQT